MKKTQRLRLAALSALAAATRTAAEQAEFTTLSALASAHPDASKDSDDTAPAAAAPVAAAPITLGSLLSASMTALRGRNGPAVDLVAARDTIGTLTTERDTARADLATANSQLSTLNSQLSASTAAVDTLCGFLGFKASELAGKQPGAIIGLVSAKVSLLAGEQIGALGFPAAAIPASAGSEAGDPAAAKELTYAAFSALTPDQKMRFSAAGGRLTD